MEQKLENFDEQERSLAADSEEASTRIQDTEAEVEALLAEEARENKALDDLRVEVSGVGAEAKQLRVALTQAEAELDDARKKHALRLKLEAEQAHKTERKKLAERELKGIEQTLPELEVALSEAQKAFDELASASQAHTDAIKSHELRVSQIRKEEETDAQSVRQSMAERASLEGRRRGIEATIDAHEGLNQGSRAVLEAAERGLIQGEFTPVGSAIDVDKEMALAIETALGGSANDLIVDDDRIAKTAIEWPKQQRAGRATFQPIPLMRPSEINADFRRLLNEKGVVGRASQLVECKSKHRPVIDSLLGRVIVVEDLDVALRHAKSQGWARLVTLDGEVVHSSGAVTGGQQSKQGYGLVQRRADLTEMAKELDRLEKLIGQYDKRSMARRRSSQEAEAGIIAERGSIQAEQEDLKDARAYLQTLTDEQKSTQRSRERLLHELEQLSKSATDADVQVDVAGRGSPTRPSPEGTCRKIC